MHDKLIRCPICKSQPKIELGIQDYEIFCSDDCPAPRCTHFDQKHTTISWNDWARWFLETDCITLSSRKGGTTMDEYWYHQVGPGWWPLLDEADRRLLEIDPDMHICEVKEKYGMLRLDVATENDDTRQTLYNIAHEIENRTDKICEYCGAPGKLITRNGWVSCRCERCADLKPPEQWQIMSETKAKYAKHHLIRSVAGSMALSGFELTEKDKERIRLVSNDPDAAETVVRKLVEKHQKDRPD